MKAKCKKCGDTIEVTKPREFKSCKCGAIYLDYGDGRNYFRVGGNTEDFDGGIEGAPEIRHVDDSMERAMDTTNTRLVDPNLNNIATYLEELSIALEETSDLVSKISRLVMERSDKSEEFNNMIEGK